MIVVWKHKTWHNIAINAVNETLKLISHEYAIWCNDIVSDSTNETKFNDKSSTNDTVILFDYKMFVIPTTSRSMEWIHNPQIYWYYPMSSTCAMSCFETHHEFWVWFWKNVNGHFVRVVSNPWSCEWDNLLGMSPTSLT